MRIIILLISLSLLAGCGPVPQIPIGTLSPVNSQPGSSAPPAPGISPIPATQPTVRPTPQPVAQPPVGLASLALAVPTRYLYAKGESVRLGVVLLDAAGRPLTPAGPLALEWSSSRPGDLSVDTGGTVTALVADGYSEISVRLGGTAFSAATLLSVTDLASGGGHRRDEAPAPTSATGTFVGTYD